MSSVQNSLALQTIHAVWTHDANKARGLKPQQHETRHESYRYLTTKSNNYLKTESYRYLKTDRLCRQPNGICSAAECTD